MRLTKKITDGHYYSKNLTDRPHDPLYPFTPQILDEVWELERNKLGQLEDIEEELGIDLLLYLKVMSQRIIFIKGKEPEWAGYGTKKIFKVIMLCILIKKN